MIALSEQQLVDCSSPYCNRGCTGVFMNYAFKYTRDKGPWKEATIHTRIKSVHGERKDIRIAIETQNSGAGVCCINDVASYTNA